MMDTSNEFPMNPDSISVSKAVLNTKTNEVSLVKSGDVVCTHQEKVDLLHGQDLREGENSQNERDANEKEESNSVSQYQDKNHIELITVSQQLPINTPHLIPINLSSDSNLSEKLWRDSKTQEGQSNNIICHELLPNTCNNTEAHSISVKNIDCSSSNVSVNFSNEVDSNDNRETNCNPIIYSVCGNAKDIENSTSTSITTIVSSMSIRNDKIICESETVLLQKNTEGGLTPVTCDKDSTHRKYTVACEASTATPAINLNLTSEQMDTREKISPLTLNTASSNKDTGLSRVTGNFIKMPSSSPSPSMVSNKSIDNNSMQISSESTDTYPASLEKTASNVISVSVPITVPTRGAVPLSTSGRPSDNPFITSNASSSVTLANQHYFVKKKLMAPTTKNNASTVKIVLKGSEKILLPKKIPVADSGRQPKMISVSSVSSLNNNRNKNDNRSTSSIDIFTKAIVDKMFSNFAKRDIEGMTRDEIFDTNLLETQKNQRKNPDKIFVCSVCGDEFYLGEFLNHHLDRKVFTLTYFCNTRKESITFFNKCKFWLHLRKEGIDIETFKKDTSYFSLKPYLNLDFREKDLACLKSPLFKCKFCKYEFYTSEERKAHYKRSLPYLYTCSKCSLLLANRCALLAHLAIHEADGKDVVCPECGIDIDHSDGLGVLFEHLDSCYHFNMAYAIPCQCGILFTSTTAFKLHLLKSHTKLLYRCQICCKCFSFYEILVDHYKDIHKTSPILLKIVLCTLCNQGSQNFQKLKLHIESHADNIAGLRKKVLSCFICRKTFSYPRTLNNHVEKEHTHRAKRCTICFGLFESRQTLVQHIVSKSCCPKNLPKKLHFCMDDSSEQEYIGVHTYKQIFYPTKRNSQSQVSHKVHSSVTVTSINTFQISNKVTTVSEKLTAKRKLTENIDHRTDGQKFQCHSCKICLIGSHNYAKHMELHKSFGFLRPQTHCGVCKKIVDDSLIQSHMENHQKRGIIVCSHCHSRNFGTMLDALQHSKNLCFYKTVENDGASFIKNDKHQNSNENSVTIGIDIIEEDENNVGVQSSNMKTNQEKASVFPCLMCGLAFASKHEKEDHVSRFHDGTRTLYFCLMCKRKGNKKFFSKKNLISKHISRKHRIVNPNEITKLILEEEQNVASGHVVPTEFIDQDNGGAPPPKRLRLETEGEFMCGKCGFSSEDTKLFEEHIATHNPKREPQCPECGLCFTVLAALKKHLFVVHKIKAMDTYLEKKGMLVGEEEVPEESDDDDDMDVCIISSDKSVLNYSPPQQESKCSNLKVKGTNSSRANKLECNVCYRTFSSEAVLKSHMRNHGMAFIRSKRYDKTSV